MRTRRNTAVWITLLALLAVGVVGLWRLEQERPRHRCGNSSVEDSNGRTDHRPGTSASSQEPGPACKGQGGQRPEAQQPPPHASATIRIIGPSGESLRSLRCRWLCPAASGDREAETATDDEGRFALPVKGPGRLTLESLSPDWWLPREHLISPGHELTIRAREALSFRLMVLLEDGVAFKGGITVSSHDQAGELLYRRMFHSNGQDAVSVQSLPKGANLEVFAHATVLGYPAQSVTVEASTIVRDQTVIVTLRKDPGDQNGAVEIDFNGYPPKGQRIAITAKGQNLEVDGGSHGSRTGAIWRSGPIAPGEYVLRIIGDTLWESEPFIVEAQRVTRLTPDPYQPATVTATIVNEQGHPTSVPGAKRGAVLSRFDQSCLPDWISASDQPGMLALADAQGHATLTGVRPGLRRFVVDAPHHEPCYFELVLMPGETHDLGLVKLRPAAGKIIVRLTGMREGMTYIVHVGQPRGAAIRMELSVTTREVVFERLPLRTYLVAVAPGESGGLPVSAQAALTELESEAVVEFDVSGLEPAKRR